MGETMIRLFILWFICSAFTACIVDEEKCGEGATHCPAPDPIGTSYVGYVYEHCGSDSLTIIMTDQNDSCNNIDRSSYVEIISKRVTDTNNTIENKPLVQSDFSNNSRDELTVNIERCRESNCTPSTLYVSIDNVNDSLSSLFTVSGHSPFTYDLNKCYAKADALCI